MIKNNINFIELELENFKSIGPKLVFNFQKHYGLNYIFGNNLDIDGTQNGVGKSTIFADGVLFSLYGKTLRNTNNEFIPCRAIEKKRNSKSLAKLTFEINGDLYISEVELPCKGTCITVSQRLWKNDEEITKSTLRETRKFLENEILKCNYELFKNSIILSSIDIQNFFSKNKTQKRDYIESIFKLTCFGEMYKNIREDIKNMNKEILFIQKENKLLNDNLNKYVEKAKTFEEEKQTKQQKLLDIVSDKELKIENLKVKFNEDEYKKKEKLKLLDGYEEKILKINNATNKIKNSINNFQNKIKNNNKELNKHSDILELLCDKCHDVVDRAFNISGIVKDNAHNNLKISKYNNDLQKLNDSKNSIDNKIKILKKISEEVLQVIEDIKHNKWVKEHLKEDIKNLKKEIKELDKQDSPFNDLINKTKEEFENKNNTLKKYYSDKEHLEILQHVVSEDGAKKYIIIDLVNILNNLVRKYLCEMGAEYTVMFDNAFNCTFLTNTGECEFSSFSNGERQRINIAVLFSFRDILCNGGVNSNIFVLDEILDMGIDQYALNSLINILKHQVEDRNQTVYLISHRKEISDNSYFNNIIEIEKKNSLTKIKKDPQGDIDG